MTNVVAVSMYIQYVQTIKSFFFNFKNNVKVLIYPRSREAMDTSWQSYRNYADCILKCIVELSETNFECFKRKIIDEYGVSFSEGCTKFLKENITLRLNSLVEILNFQVEKKCFTIREIEKAGKSDAPPAPEYLLSINHLRAIYTSLEIIWHWGILPFTGPVATIDNQLEHPSSLFLKLNFLCKVRNELVDSNDLSTIYLYINTMSNICKCTLFNSLMLDRVLPRILISCMVLQHECHQPCNNINNYKHIKLDEDITNCIKKSTRKILYDFVNGHFNEKVLVIYCLKYASNGPPWMQTLSTRIMTHILLSDDGLEAVIRGSAQGKYI